MKSFLELLSDLGMMPQNPKESLSLTPKLWWLSFALPGETGFLGVIILYAPSFEEAIDEAWRFEINPGGGVRGYELDSEAIEITPELANPKNHKRLLTRIEASLLGGRRLGDIGKPN